MVFQIVIEGDGLETDQYIKIFAVLNELIQTIARALQVIVDKGDFEQLEKSLRESLFG